MTVEERQRRKLQEALVGSIGADPTDTLMTYLSPAGWGDIATKDDLTVLRGELHVEVAGVREEMRTEIAGVRTEIAGLRGEMHEKFGEIDGSIGALEGKIGELRAGLHDILRTNMYWTLTLLVLILSFFGAAIKLL